MDNNREITEAAKINEGHEERNQEDNDEARSDDVFFEDISSSLINIREGSTKLPASSKAEGGSGISNPFEEKRYISDLDCNSRVLDNERGEPSHMKEMGQLANQQWRRVINIANRNSIQEITGVEERNQFDDFSGDFQVESSYQRTSLTTTRRVYRYRQSSSFSTSARPQMAISESSVLSGDFRTSMSMFENEDSDSVFDENVLTEEVACHSEGFFIN